MASDIENTPPITDEDVERDTFGAERLANQQVESDSDWEVVIGAELDD